jgi:protein-disulfide isomerase
MANLKVSVTSEDHIQGSEDAAVTLVEYGDYQCPHCGVAYSIVKQVQERYRDDLRLVFRNFPLAEIHAHAESAAEAAEFAGANGSFWEMHDGIYENQQRLSTKLLLELASGIGLSVDDLREALASHEFAPRVKKDFLGGVRSGVNGTPTFFINGVRHDGAYDFQTLTSAIDAQLPQRRAAG